MHHNLLSNFVTKWLHVISVCSSSYILNEDYVRLHLIFCLSITAGTEDQASKPLIAERPPGIKVATDDLQG